MDGHVLGVEDACHCRTAMTLIIQGKRKVGRPRITWRHTEEKERKQLGWKSWGEKPIKLGSSLQPYGPLGAKRKGEVR